MADHVARELHLPPHGGTGLLRLPDAQVHGLVLFAHGSGSSRLSPRNTFVAEALREVGLASLLLDLLTEAEAADRARVFDIPLLAERLTAATDWVRESADLRALPIGYFGASTGAAAALVAAAHRHGVVRAVVARGGRPDLAQADLPNVAAATLLIVGGADHEVLEFNRRAYELLACERRLSVVPGATHLFEEPGALEQVVALARAWFLDHLAAEPGDDFP
jgi:putative phosphoribosyl transferase